VALLILESSDVSSSSVVPAAAARSTGAGEPAFMSNSVADSGAG